MGCREGVVSGSSMARMVHLLCEIWGNDPGV